MKAQRRLGLALRGRGSPRRSSSTSRCWYWPVTCPGVPQHVAWWAGVAVAAVVTIAAVYSPTGGSRSPRLSPGARAGSVGRSRMAALSRGRTPAIDHRRRFGHDVVGVREYLGQLVAVIAVDGPADAPSGRHQREIAGVGHLAGGGGRRGRCASSMCALTPSTSSRCESDTSPRPPIRPPRRPPTIAPRVRARHVAGVTDGSAAAMSRRWRPAIRWPRPWRRPSSGSPAIWTDGTARPGR